MHCPCILALPPQPFLQAPPTAGVSLCCPSGPGGGVRCLVVTMGSKMAAATRVVQVTALGLGGGWGREPGAGGGPRLARGRRGPRWLRPEMLPERPVFLARGKKCAAGSAWWRDSGAWFSWHQKVLPGSLRAAPLVRC